MNITVCCKPHPLSACKVCTREAAGVQSIYAEVMVFLVFAQSGKGPMKIFLVKDYVHMREFCPPNDC